MLACVHFRTVLPLILLLSCTCRSPAQREAAPSAPAPGELWVAPGREGSGDGSQARPLRSLSEALARPGPLTVRLAPGRYRGPFVLPPGTRLEGLGPGVVLEGGAPEVTVLQVGAGVAVSDVVVEGGEVGLSVADGGQVRLARGTFRGQRLGAVRVSAGALDVEGCQFEGSPTAAVGVLIERGPSPRGDTPSDSESAPAGATPETLDANRVAGAGESTGAEAPPGAPPGGDPHLGTQARARIRSSTFTGPYRRAVRVRGANSQVVVEDTRFSGPATAVSVDEARAEVRRSTSEGGTAAAFSVMNGTLVLDEVKVTGHEYAVSAMQARELEVRRFTSVRAVRAGMGLTLSKARLRDIVVRDSGEYGGLQFMGGDVDAERVRIEGAAEYGLMAIRGKLRLRDATIERVRTSDGIAGDGLHLRQLQADVDDVTVRDAQGTCVLVAQDARVSLRAANLRGCGAAGLVVDTLARLRASDVELHGAATALGVLGEGELHVDGLTARDLVEGFVHADCGGATQVRLRNVRTEDTRGLSAACVQREGPSPGPSK